MVSPTARTRTFAGVAGGALVTATLTLATAGPAHALAIPVSCDNGGTSEIVLSWDDATYELSGTCGKVRITADRATVTMPTARQLIVEGQGNVVRSKSVALLEVRGTGQQVMPTSVQTLVVSGSHSTVAVTGLAETVTVTGAADTVTAHEIDIGRLVGTNSALRAPRGYVARISGNDNTARFDRLDTLVVPGDRNRVRVTQGRTQVRVTGVGNHILVHRRA